MWNIILCTIVSLVAGKQVTFENYKVFNIAADAPMQTQLLNRLAHISDGFSFWKASSVNKQMQLMVAPYKLSEFYEMMAQIQAPYEVYIENVQTLINRGTPANVSMEFDFKNYHPLKTIYKNLDDMAKRYPNIVQTIVGGKTYEKREIKGVKISYKANNPGVFIEGGVHAREWISTATVMYIFHQLLTSNNTEVRTLAESHDWYIFPVFNPDGYVYTHTTNRFWRKTRKPYDNCYGADPNRNWNYKWNTAGSSNDTCSETYAGPAPFSEIETKSMSKYINSISKKFYAYIAFHSYSQLLMFPYGYTTDRVENYDDLYNIGMKAITALAKRYGTEYAVGSIAETIYLASGNTVDWIKGMYNKSIIYIYELRDQGQYGFLLPPEQIIPTGEETLDSVIAILKEATMLIDMVEVSKT
ncbi:PREDICTED: zinc carboxypeptidase-like [Cyphomyrmex costatus]|uniref:zinc carboxypeptidase-like n=1 Tax=Cyphomyrmex costatus TaxID=456900 RepID=UPI0008522F99|nr:PREDICTED: zinc carboxypeptidase-like [Cyphomyrmex costatus]